MQIFDISRLPTAINITLYRYNYIDNKIWTQIHNEVDYIEYGQDSIMVSMNQIQYIIERHYNSMVNKIMTLGSEAMHKEINSVYFLYQIYNNMPNIKYVKIDLNFDKSYDRTIESDGDKVLQFGFSILSATLRLTDLYNEDELPYVNKLLETAGVLIPEKPYIRIRAKTIIQLIEDLMLAHENDEEEMEDDSSILIDIIEVLQTKLEPENSLILLITDY